MKLEHQHKSCNVYLFCICVFSLLVATHGSTFQRDRTSNRGILMLLETFFISSWRGSQISRIVAEPAFVFLRLLRLRHSVEKLGLWPAYSHVTSWLMNVCCTRAQFDASVWRIWHKASLNNHKWLSILGFRARRLQFSSVWKNVFYKK